MSYAMRWMLRVQPEDDEQVAQLRWRGESSAPHLPSTLGPHGEVWSWYDVDGDMRELSARFPSLLFILDVHNAEEPGLYPPERWFFKAGRLQKVTASLDWPEFDPSKLA